VGKKRRQRTQRAHNRGAIDRAPVIWDGNSFFASVSIDHALNLVGVGGLGQRQCQWQARFPWLPVVPETGYVNREQAFGWRLKVFL